MDDGIRIERRWGSVPFAVLEDPDPENDERVLGVQLGTLESIPRAELYEPTDAADEASAKAAEAAREEADSGDRRPVRGLVQPGNTAPAAGETDELQRQVAAARQAQADAEADRDQARAELEQQRAASTTNPPGGNT